MAYSKEVFDAAMRRLEQRRQQTDAETDRTRAELYTHIPRLREIQDELAGTAVNAVREMLAGGDTAANMERLKKINLNLQAERAELLTANGLPPDMMTPKRYCRQCDDTGYVGDRVCDCLRTLLREEACKRANSGSPLPLRAFDTFDLSYYPDTPLPGADTTVRAYMGRVFAYCKQYTEQFSPTTSPSLLFLGGTGLGKTHLALAVANEVLGRGFSVIYDTAQNIFSKIEDEHFGRGEQNFTQTVYDCDLLILDELPDYATSFTNSTFYNIINTRTLAHRPAIVSTNLTEKELEARYGQKIFSRLIGDFWMFKFFGRDIRQLKLKKNIF
ncbi:MAG: ATP-binding protein [Ethanoligenens sp.]|uniref:ATP-binding protein n=1 Tax=Ethanoligenens sp. TaxID=2099655 RepID=UPI0039EB29DC